MLKQSVAARYSISWEGRIALLQVKLSIWLTVQDNFAVLYTVPNLLAQYPTPLSLLTCYPRSDLRMS